MLPVECRSRKLLNDLVYRLEIGQADCRESEPHFHRNRLTNTFVLSFAYLYVRTICCLESEGLDGCDSKRKRSVQAVSDGGVLIVSGKSAFCLCD